MSLQSEREFVWDCETASPTSSKRKPPDAWACFLLECNHLSFFSSVTAVVNLQNDSVHVWSDVPVIVFFFYLNVGQTGLSHIHVFPDRAITKSLLRSSPLFLTSARWTYSLEWSTRSVSAPKDFNCASRAMILSPMYPDASSSIINLQTHSKHQWIRLTFYSAYFSKTGSVSITLAALFWGKEQVGAGLPWGEASVGHDYLNHWLFGGLPYYLTEATDATKAVVSGSPSW